MIKKTTVYTIAEEAGVSPATVSRVINHPELVGEETLRSIRDIMTSHGWNISEKLQPKGKPVLILNVPDINNIFYNEIIDGAMASAQAHGCFLLVSHYPLVLGSTDEFIRLISQLNAAGAILLQKLPKDALEHLNSIVPVIQCCEYNSETDIPFVSIDDRKAAEEATDYLINKGRTRIAFFDGPLQYKYAYERKKGFQMAMNRASLSTPKSWIVQLPRVDHELAYAVACQIISKDVIPNAFFSVSDTMAAAIIRAARKYKYSVPDDISVIGFDDTVIASMFSPSITTIRQPKYQAGYTACEMLLEKIATPNTYVRSINLDTELIIRETA